MKKLKGSKKKKKLSAGKIALIVLVTVLAVMIAAIVVCMAMVNHYLNLIPKDKDGPSDIVSPDDEDFETDYIPGIDETLGPGETLDPDVVTEAPGPEIDPGDVTWPDDPPDVDNPPANKSGLVNILLVGQDRRPGEARQRSDSMILISINTDKKKITVGSFLRDMYVQIPGYSDNRLNVAYKFGGFPLLKKTIYKNFGITVDGCFECDFDDFKEIIDLLGGVTVYVDSKEANHLKNFFHVSVSGTGNITLNGKQALAYARIRKIDSDFGRTSRQQEILMSLFKKFRTASVSELNNIANAILPKLLTDMSNSDIMSLMAKVIPMIGSIDMDNITQYQVPFNGMYKSATIRKMSVLVPDLKKIRSKLSSTLPY